MIGIESGEVVEVGVDWITATAKTGPSQGLLVDVATDLVRRAENDGDDCQEFSWRGYHGQHCGGITWGVRYDGALVQLSGVTAARYWMDVREPSDNVSRLDLQVTVRVPERLGDLAALAYTEAEAFEPARGSKIGCTRIYGSDGGSTTYLGSPASARRLRIYNKHVESKMEHYAGCWRYEIQLRDDIAKGMAVWLANSDVKADAITAYLREFCVDHGCNVPWPATGVLFDLQQPPVVHDDDKSLRWIDKGVRPTVLRLWDRGRAQHVVDALGLHELVHILDYQSTSEEG